MSSKDIIQRINPLEIIHIINIYNFSANLTEHKNGNNASMPLKSTATTI